MRQLEKRQIILLAVLAVLIVAFLAWKFVLSSDSGNEKSVEPVTTQTTVATGQVTEDPANPATATDPTVTAGLAAVAAIRAGAGPDRRAVQHLRLPRSVPARGLTGVPRDRPTGPDARDR